MRWAAGHRTACASNVPTTAPSTRYEQHRLDIVLWTHAKRRLVGDDGGGRIHHERERHRGHARDETREQERGARHLRVDDAGVERRQRARDPKRHDDDVPEQERLGQPGRAIAEHARARRPELGQCGGKCRRARETQDRPHERARTFERVDAALQEHGEGRRQRTTEQRPER